MRRVVWLPLVLSGLASLLSSTDGFGQGFQGGVRGAVRDSGGVIPGVEVLLVNDATNVSRSTVSNVVGEYAFAAVAPGTYTVRATLTGYKTFERKGLTIGTQQFITLDMVLELGTVEETVIVSAAAPLIEVSNASTGQELDQQLLQSLPALTRNVFQMAASVPTVLTYGDPYQSRMEDQSNASSISLGGGMRRGNGYLLDGVSLSDLQNRASAFPSMEGVADTKVQLHTYDAEVGRTGGGVFNTTAKSGTNSWHGSGFFQDRPWSLQARSYFDKLAGKEQPSGPYYYYHGESVGGPIRKNKLFFYSSHEGYVESLSGTSAGVLPTDLERQGDFSQTFTRDGRLVVIYDPLTTRQLPDGTYTRDPFPGNKIPANRLSTVAKNILTFMPPADTQVSGGGTGLSNYQYTSPIPTYADQFVNKVEVKLSANHSLSGLYLFQNSSEQHTHFWHDGTGGYVARDNPLAVAGPDHGDELRQVHVIALNDTIVVNSSTTLALRYGYTRFNDHVSGFEYDGTQLGFPASFVNAQSFKRFPNGTIQGYTVGAGGTFGDRAQSLVDYPQFNVNGVITKLIGTQTLKMGADWRTIGALNDQPNGATGGTFNFDKEWTQANPLVANANQGNALASFLLGLPSANAGNLSTTPISTPIDVHINSIAGFFQDDFRPNSRLTLNMGVRYEYETGMREADNRFTVAFDRTATSPLAALTGLDLHGGLRYAGVDGWPTEQGHPSHTKFSPRIGSVFSFDPKTVVRAGYGLYWAPWLYSAPGTDSFGQIGYTAQTSVAFVDNLIPTVSLDNPYPNGLLQPSGNSGGLLTGVGDQIRFVNQDRRTPRVQEFSVDVQRELPRNMMVQATYMGTRGANLSSGSGLNINQLDPQYLSLGSALNTQVPNPFFGIPQAGAFSRSRTIARGQLLRPFAQFGNVLMLQDDQARSRYDGIVLELNRRRSGGIAWRANYTWSRLSDSQVSEAGSYASGNQNGRLLNNYDLEQEYSISQLDVPHRVQISPVVELPFGEGKHWATNGLASKILGGWQVSANLSFESGSPINVVQSSDNTGSFSGQQRPNLVPGVSPATEGSTLDRLNNYINPAAFTLAAPFTFGDAPRTMDTLRAPFRQNYDLVVQRSVPTGSQARLSFKVEVLNLTDSVKFLGGPAASFGTATFGKLTAQAGFPRLVQFTVRVDF